MTNQYIGRFAPSPTGPLHLGSIFAGVVSYLDAKANPGKWLLRIEDIDFYRCQSDISYLIQKQLEAFHLYWDDTVVFQSERLEYYQYYFELLKNKGLVYPYFCTRKNLQLQRLWTNGFVHIKCDIDTESDLKVTKKQPSFRIRVPNETLSFLDGIMGNYAQNLKKEVGDFILKRSDGCFAYQLAVVVDDELQGVTHIVRGQDLLISTPRQLYLQTCLNFRKQNYKHFSLLLNHKGQKLSKQTHSPAVNLENKIKILTAIFHWLNFSSPIPECDRIEELLFWGIEHWHEVSLKKENTIIDV